MGVSFTGQYLYCGALVFSRHPLVGPLAKKEWPEAVYATARAVYSLGIPIVATLGTLYHLSCGLHQKVVSHWRPPELMGQLKGPRLHHSHFETAATDIAVLLRVTLDALFIASLIAALFYQMFICAIPAATILLLLRKDLFALFVGPAQDARFFMRLLPYPDMVEYEGRFFFKKFVQEGTVVDGPLSRQEARAIQRVLEQRSRTYVERKRGEPALPLRDKLVRLDFFLKIAFYKHLEQKLAPSRKDEVLGLLAQEESLLDACMSSLRADPSNTTDSRDLTPRQELRLENVAMSAYAQLRRSGSQTQTPASSQSPA